MCTTGSISTTMYSSDVKTVRHMRAGKGKGNDIPCLVPSFPFSIHFHFSKNREIQFSPKRGEMHFSPDHHHLT
ncbi:hypothetical protein L1987_65680 [Smallanthus sonchifolius]|uniref:Uncharacterized protein n=1 Tax=Smallanthus sonchifolius TaxID=185202 RepID=A0ACB9BV16_9ASTR|nr:hypothetical protein L1987_65680 [Smallanthus sonchifolius]